MGRTRRGAPRDAGRHGTGEGGHRDRTDGRAVERADRILAAIAAPYLATFDQLPMGVVEKTWLRFSEPIFGVSDQQTYLGQILRADGIPPGIQFNFFGANVMACIVGGEVALSLVHEGRDALVDFAKQSAAELFGPPPSGVTVTATASSWYTEDYTRGENGRVHRTRDHRLSNRHVDD